MAISILPQSRKFNGRNSFVENFCISKSKGGFKGAKKISKVLGDSFENTTWNKKFTQKTSMHSKAL